MARRNYGQPCSVAGALDRIGERWTMLIVRELSLGPLRFSALARSVGGAPTDVPYDTKGHKAFHPPKVLPRANPANAVVGNPPSVIHK